MTLPEVIAVVARAVALAGIVVTSGAVVFHWAVLRRASIQSTIPARAGLLASVCVLVIAPLRLYAQARAFVDTGDPVTPMMGNVLETLWGRGLLLQGSAALVALLAFSVARRGARWAWWLVLIPALVLCCTPAYMGHAAAAEQYAGVSIAVDVTHVVAASSWIGALFLLALVIRAQTSGDSAAILIQLFHPVALTSAGILVVTGVMSLSFRVLHFRYLLHSEYGALFAIKVALTMAVAGLGFYHSRRGATLARASGVRAVMRTLAAESATAVLVIAMTAMLVGTSPPTEDALPAPTSTATQ